MTNSIQYRIRELKNESANTGDVATYERCEAADCYELHDSDTSTAVEPEELFPHEDYPMHKYVETIIESLHCEQAEGHVRIGGRRVYAQ